MSFLTLSFVMTKADALPPAMVSAACIVDAEAPRKSPNSHKAKCLKHTADSLFWGKLRCERASLRCLTINARDHPLLCTNGKNDDGRKGCKYSVRKRFGTCRVKFCRKA